MEHDHSTHEPHVNHRKSVYTAWLVVIGLFGAYYLLTQHFTHVMEALPYALLLACPLMHLFMHHGHGGHGEHHTSETRSHQTPQQLESVKEPPAKQQ